MNIASRLRQAAHVAVLSALAAASVACGGAPKPGNFPTKADLADLATAPPPSDLFQKGAVDAERWQLTGPLPDAVESSVTDDTSPWTQTLVDVISARPGQVVASRGMACVARQIAAFAAEKDALPASPLVRFMTARCGVPSTSIGMSLLTQEVPEDTSDKEIYAGWEEKVKAALPAGLATGPRLAGIGLVRKGKRAALAIAFSARWVKMEDVPLVPEGGKVVLRGELLSTAATVLGLVTRGRFGYEQCVRDVDLQLPKFAIECPVSPDDPTARIEVAAFQEGRELGDRVIDLGVYPAGKLDLEYTHTAASSDALPEGDALPAAMLKGINDVRASAGLPAVTSSAAESRTAAQLAPYYFASLQTGDAGVSDKVALGLLAGWDVEGQVREGHFGAVWSYERDVQSLVEAAIASPFGRETLLDPRASRVALGPVIDKEGKAFGAVFSTYSLIDATGQADSASAVLARLTKLRGKIKRPAPAIASELDPVLADVTARVETGLSLEEALKRTTSKSIELIRRGSVKSYVATASSVDKLEFPSEILATSDLRLGVAVARYRPEGSPWTRLAVFFVILQEPPGPTNTASRGGRHSG
ncbi:MAG: hypothetical protein U0441_31390 [Polyangiaceae bacterium]